MFSYVAYGLSIRSDLPLPELVAGGAGTDVLVRWGRVDRLPSAADATGTGFWAKSGEACHFVEGVGAFGVRCGREIIVEPAVGVEQRVLRLFILGPVLGVLLHQRGFLVLHASAVAANGFAVSFLGGRGWGKSTVAAAFHARGHAFVADDVTAIDMSPGGFTVLPAFPQLKLWPEGVVSLGEAPERLPRIHPLVEKRARRATQGFSRRPCPLKRIYVLAEGPDPAIEPLRPQEALIELVRHSYGTRLLKLDGAACLHFLQCTRLATHITICRLRRPRSLPVLSDLANLVEDDLARDQ